MSTDDTKPNHVPIAMCACLKVRYTPIELPNGLMRERWSCTACGCDFVRDIQHNLFEMHSRLHRLEGRPVIVIKDGKLDQPTVDKLKAILKDMELTPMNIACDVMGDSLEGVSHSPGAAARRHLQALVARAAVRWAESGEDEATLQGTMTRSNDHTPPPEPVPKQRPVPQLENGSQLTPAAQRAMLRTEDKPMADEIPAGSYSAAVLIAEATRLREQRRVLQDQIRNMLESHPYHAAIETIRKTVGLPEDADIGLVVMAVLNRLNPPLLP